MAEQTRRDFLETVAGGALAATLGGCATTGGGAPVRKPNIVFFFADQFRADLCGVYGGSIISTPNIDRFASEGMLFENGLSTCPVCTPYRGMVATGRYPTHSGILLNWIDASPAQNPECLANVFSEAGYDTGYIGKWHLSAGRFRTAGLVEQDNEIIQAYVKETGDTTEFTPPGPQRLGFDHWQAYNFHCDFSDYWWYEDEPQRKRSERYETDAQVDQAIAYMQRRAETDPPFLLMVAPHPPHPPFAPKESPEGYLEQIPKDIPWPPNVSEDNPRKLPQLRCYLAMSKHVDDAFGRLLAYLDESGLADNTIVVFTSDHGEMHGSHGRINKMVPYAEAVNVPLIVRWPGQIPAGERSPTLYTPMDHFPTLCGLAGLRAPSMCDGEDLSRAVRGKGRSGRDHVLMANYSSHWDFFQSGTNWPEWRGVHTGRYTYVRWLTGEEELYDNEADPYQMSNLAGSIGHRKLMTGLQRKMADRLADAHDGFLPGTAYREWFDDRRRLVRTALGPH